MRFNGLILIGVALLLTGCASDTGATAGTPTPTRTPTPTAAQASALQLCEVASERLLDYPDYVLAISEGKFDDAVHDEYNAWAGEVENAAPADAKAIVGKFLDPIRQVQAVVENGGGSLSFTTDDFKSGNLELLQYCVDAGYKMSD
ncbi:hypothetical protein [Microbacterium hibisci]|uniref:hypothetical protein n=1 Tax=Microbacterium hibisci TaxID=2036000 RepID=UPI00194416F9|nr:hypothetical protein [Microbacterium hibisci]